MLPVSTRSSNGLWALGLKEMIEPPARRLAQGAKIPKEDTQRLKQFSFAGKRQKKAALSKNATRFWTIHNFAFYSWRPWRLGGSKFSCFF